ncbi:MAG: DNA repair protein RecN [Spirochaetaceae bacterium]|jgi:DNA repair protein RecN (Recombination protein N)|nr:DNA repair protein RecN [Spirochaetaceae bacterium]
MLLELSIRNYALIDNLSLSFDRGFTILTGETGAGKSIIVGALSFILGGKAGADIIRTGTDEASVSAVVGVAEENAEVRSWLAERDIPLEDGKLFVRRLIKSSGRSSIYIQNIPQSLRDLGDCMAQLFDLHGQHQHESLMRPETHRRYLDRFAGLVDEAAAYNQAFLRLAEKKKLLDSSEKSQLERDSRIDMLKYAAEEIAEAQVKPGEMRELLAESARLSGYEKLAGLVEQGAGLFCEDNASVLNLARKARSIFDSAAGIDNALGPLQKRISDLYYEAEDIAGELRSYGRGLSFDPDRLESVENRLAKLQKLRKKYANDAGNETQAEEKILSYAADADAEIEALSSLDANREKMTAEIRTLEKDVVTRAASLTARRKEKAAALSSSIMAILGALGMSGARFAVSLEPKGDGKKVYGPWGADEIEFLISANKGEPLRELARIASGGELSRIMLAIKAVLAGPASNGPDTIETLVFDEIDTGIGGEVAVSVAKYLAELSKNKQLFCISHLASIASKADNHLKVEKGNAGERVITTVKPLAGTERRSEIARMLSGGEGESALKHAGELLGFDGESLGF